MIVSDPGHSACKHTYIHTHCVNTHRQTNGEAAGIRRHPTTSCRKHAQHGSMACGAGTKHPRPYPNTSCRNPPTAGICWPNTVHGHRSSMRTKSQHGPRPHSKHAYRAKACPSSVFVGSKKRKTPPIPLCLDLTPHRSIPATAPEHAVRLQNDTHKLMETHVRQDTRGVRTDRPWRQ